MASAMTPSTLSDCSQPATVHVSVTALAACAADGVLFEAAWDASLRAAASRFPAMAAART